jgi:hypothetical protein
VDCVYTCLEPGEREKVYAGHTNVRELRTTLPGLVSEHFRVIGGRFARADGARTIDVGYRGRPLEPYMGRAAREKYDIGVEFKRRTAGSGLTLDIECEESARIYGDDWYRFVAACRATLGTESGVSVFDLEGEVYDTYRDAVADPTPERQEQFRAAAARWEDRVYYRTISPRQFEAAALGTCQILFTGRYSAAMRPMVHYLPLEKDFSNLDEVVRLYRDPDLRHELTTNARRDLVDSGAYGYETLVRDVDDLLDAQGVMSKTTSADRAAVEAILGRGRTTRAARARAAHLASRLRAAQWPGRSVVRGVYRRIHSPGRAL